MPFTKFTPSRPEKSCRHPEHNPPGHIVLPPGEHEYTCPGCGQKTTFTVQSPECESGIFSHGLSVVNAMSYLKKNFFDDHRDAGCVGTSLRAGKLHVLVVDEKAKEKMPETYQGIPVVAQVSGPIRARTIL